MLLGIGSAAVAQAAPAQAAWSIFLRAGPGQQYAVLDEIGAHSIVDRQACRDGWCLVVFGDRAGYVAQGDLLATNRAPPASVTVPCFTDELSGFRGGDAYRFCGK